jgi:adenine-specific DNA methylase
MVAMKRDLSIQSKQREALKNFVSFIPNIFESDNIESMFRSLVKPFGFDIVVLEDSKMTEDAKLYAITKAIRQLKRLGKKPSIISISRIVKMNQWNCRQLMVKYGMFNVDTKEITNYFDDWKDPDF